MAPARRVGSKRQLLVTSDAEAVRTKTTYDAVVAGVAGRCYVAAGLIARAAHRAMRLNKKNDLIVVSARC